MITNAIIPHRKRMLVVHNRNLLNEISNSTFFPITTACYIEIGGCLISVNVLHKQEKVVFTKKDREIVYMLHVRRATTDGEQQTEIGIKTERKMIISHTYI